VFQGPALFQAAGEWVQDGGIFQRGLRHGNYGDPFGGRRQGGEEREGQMADRFTELGVVRAVPRVNRIESFESWDAGGGNDSEEVEASVDDGAGAVGEADQGEDGARGPYFRVVGSRGF